MKSAHLSIVAAVFGGALGGAIGLAIDVPVAGSSATIVVSEARAGANLDQAWQIYLADAQAY